MRPRAVITIGAAFGHLTIIRFVGIIKGHSTVSCACVCGSVKNFTYSNLKNACSASCGCKPNAKTHGAAIALLRDRTNMSWRAMISRCTAAPGTKHHKNYVLRGISYPVEWNVYENFLRDMGKRPIGMTLDRKNNDLGYSKENCRWATVEEQSNNRGNNRFVELEGRRQTLSQWARELGVSRHILRTRFKAPSVKAPTK